ncbi:MAG: helix-turn-helix transcriptional regulator, partial [Planctomycetes bacterium]|nr:helix-turn-helix transcriptional regulator [Planctomycetota bacterium]
VLLMRLVVIEQPQTVSELADCCGVHLSGVSRHLAMLRDAGILDAQKSGREVRYELRREELANTLRLIADAIEI